MSTAVRPRKACPGGNLSIIPVVVGVGNAARRSHEYAERRRERYEHFFWRAVSPAGDACGRTEETAPVALRGRRACGFGPGRARRVCGGPDPGSDERADGPDPLRRGVRVGRRAGQGGRSAHRGSDRPCRRHFRPDPADLHARRAHGRTAPGRLRSERRRRGARDRLPRRRGYGKRRDASERPGLRGEYGRTRRGFHARRYGLGRLLHLDSGRPHSRQQDDPDGLFERHILQSFVDDLYAQFVDVISEGRDIPKDRVREIADGRVYSGLQAKKLGLIDSFGGLDEASAIAGNLAGTSDTTVVRYVQQPSFTDRLLARLALEKPQAEQIMDAAGLNLEPKPYYLYRP